LNWLPYNIRREAAGTRIDWCDVPDRTLREPFFDQTIRRRIRDEGAETRTTSERALADLQPGDGSRFGGFIFHGSRCGSTLAARMLTAVPRFSVISEPLILDSASELRDEILGAFLGWAAGGGRALFVKFSARAIVDPLPIAPAPALFLYRDPLEVVVALGGKGERVPPGVGGLLDSSPETTARMRPAEFWSRVVGRQYEAAASRESLGFVNYEQLLADPARCLRDALDLDLSPSELQAMRSATSRNAKAPSKPFADDRDLKRRAATRDVRAAVLRWAREPYERLEALRLVQGTTCSARPDSADSTRDTPSSTPRSSACR
jgi:hypothetical protein